MRYSPSPATRWSAAVLAVCVWQPGCGATQIHEHHIIQSRQQDGEIAYYRVTIDGEATLAKTHFRAGLHDAEAVAELLGSGVGALGQQQSATLQLENKRREAVTTLATRYFDELATEIPEAGGTTADVRLTRLKTYGSELLRTVKQQYHTDSGYDQYAPARKYVVIFSAIASVIEEAIASFSEDADTQQMVVAMVADRERDAWLEQRARRDALNARLLLIRQIRTDLELKKDVKAAEALTQLRVILPQLAELRGTP